MELKGKIINVFAEERGQSVKGEWVKRSFLIETDEQYPKQIKIDAFGDKLNVEFIKKNNIVTVFVNIESKEYNGRYFTNINAYKIELMGKEKQEEKKQEEKYNESDELPF
jgi:hypothetical protein